MSPKTDDGVCVFGANVLHHYLDALTQEIDGVRQAVDIEYIHRMRVASRRMRTALPLFTDCLPRKKYPDWEAAVHAVTKALGAARDLDVQIELLMGFIDSAQDPHFRPGLCRLLLRLRQKRAKRQSKINQALDALEQSGVISGMGRRLSNYEEQQNQTYLYTPALYKLGYTAITTSLDNFLSYQDCVDHPEAVEQLHAMRITAKHLRYTMEIFAPLYPGELKDPIQAARKAQDLLGEIHDCDAWGMLLSAFIEQERQRVYNFYGSTRSFHRLVPGIRAFQEDRQKQRDQKYLDFVRFWEQHKGKATWTNLPQVIQIPYYRVEPPAPTPSPADQASTQQEPAA